MGTYKMRKSSSRYRCRNILSTVVMLALLFVVAIFSTVPPLSSSSSVVLVGASPSESKTRRQLLAWYDDIFYLHPTVPLPGKYWLDRIAAAANTNVAPEDGIASEDGTNSIEFVHNGVAYSSIYAAIVQEQSQKNHEQQQALAYHPCINMNAYLNSMFLSPSTATKITNTVLSMQRYYYNEIQPKLSFAQFPTSDSVSSSNITAGANATVTNETTTNFKNAEEQQQQKSNDNNDRTITLQLSHYVMCYIRNLIAAMFIYYSTALVFHYFCYIHPSTSYPTYGPMHKTDGKKYRKRPTLSTVLHQISLSQKSIFIYVLLPVIDEYLIEHNYTRAYYTISEVDGYMNHAGYLLAYFVMVEIGIYWMHRTLHTNKFLYVHIHQTHHQYKTPVTLTPWASIAFHPVDGMLQACPYVLVMTVIPCHYICHLGFLFFTAVWATYIHDAMDYNPLNNIIMGSKYHTVHHTHYIYNYGQIFTFCDRFWNTFKEPTRPTGSIDNRQKKNHHKVQ